VFLAAFRGVAGVTLVGTPSGGGSGRARGEELAHSRIAVQVSSMASFRPDGRLFDGRSVEPDRLAEPSPGFWIGREDPALVEALRVLGVE
jgi:C-terminal processing protease CtpA/Prc